MRQKSMKKIPCDFNAIPPINAILPAPRTLGHPLPLLITKITMMFIFVLFQCYNSLIFQSGINRLSLGTNTVFLILIKYIYSMLYFLGFFFLFNINSARHRSLTNKNPTWPLHCCEPKADRSEVWSLTQALGELAAIRHNIDLLLHSWEGPKHFSHFV